GRSTAAAQRDPPALDRTRAYDAGIERRSGGQTGRDRATLRGAAPADPRAPAPDQPGAQHRAGRANPERGSGETAHERAGAESGQAAAGQSGRGSRNAGLSDPGAAGPLSGGAAPVPGTCRRAGPAPPRAAAAHAGAATAAARAPVTRVPGDENGRTAQRRPPVLVSLAGPAT